MDYNKINKIDVDGNGNITLQDVTGNNITVNYNDTAEFSKLLAVANEQIINTVKEMLAEFQKTKEPPKRYTPENIKELAKEALSEGKKRKLEMLGRNLDKYYNMLDRLEEQKMTSTNPKETMRCELDIEKTNAEIKKMTDEIENLIN